MVVANGFVCYGLDVRNNQAREGRMSVSYAYNVTEVYSIIVCTLVGC